MKLWPVYCSIMLSGCINQTGIQSDYSSHRNECQGYAEAQLPQYLDAAEDSNEKAKNAKLVTLFSDCMFENGWSVATPNREGEPKDPRLRADQGSQVGAGVRIRPPGNISPNLIGQQPYPQ